MDFFARCLNVLLCNDLDLKCRLINELHQDWDKSPPTVLIPAADAISIPTPGRPSRPILVHPLHVPKRGVGSKAGHAGLIHALAHIEFNAMNLAIDACYRFQNMPKAFYTNWLQVAADEVYHFQLLNAYLQDLGYTYGDFDAHNGLWDMALKTEHDVLTRMALVPRVLEARGLDAVPEMQTKLKHIKDKRGIEILSIIHHDEIQHVKYGDKWFKYLCHERDLDPHTTYFSLLEEYAAPKIRGAFNRADRKLAGFSLNELEQLSEWSTRV